VLHLTRLDGQQSPFFVYSDCVNSSNSNVGEKIRRVSVTGISHVPFWAIVLMATDRMPLSYRDDTCLTAVDDWIFFKCKYKTLEKIRKLKRFMNSCLGKKFTNPLDDRNNAILNELQSIIKGLCASDVSPNETVAATWTEKGKIIAPETVPNEGTSSANPESLSPRSSGPSTACADEIHNVGEERDSRCED
jgi:hypothetical protein